MLNVLQAYNKTESVIENRITLKKQQYIDYLKSVDLSDIEKKIEEAINKGLYSMKIRKVPNLPNETDEYNKFNLQLEAIIHLYGYKVNSNMFTDDVTISWKKEIGIFPTPIVTAEDNI